jgi:hypothetical protein
MGGLAWKGPKGETLSVFNPLCKCKTWKKIEIFQNPKEPVKKGYGAMPDATVFGW